MPFKSLYYFVLSERFGTIAQLTVTGKSFLPTSYPILGHSFPATAADTSHVRDDLQFPK